MPGASYQGKTTVPYQADSVPEATEYGSSCAKAAIMLETDPAEKE